MSPHTGSLQYTLYFAAAGSGIQTVAHTRLLLFKESGGRIWIDRTPYEIRPGCLYVIPRGHFYYLSESFAHREAAHIDVTEPENDDSQTMHIYRVLLYRVKYTPGKLFVFEEGATPVYESLLACREDATGQQLAALLYQWSRQYSGYDFSKPPAAHQVARVQHFLEGLPATLDKGCTADMANLTNYTHTSRNTLNRDCRDILGVSPGKVIMYHKISTAVYMLLSGHDHINNAVAAAAGFGDVSCMYKKIREISNYCGSTRADTFNVQNADVPSFPFIIPDSALCPGEQYTVYAPAGHHAYLWSDGSTADTLIVNTPGKHWLRISNICGSGRTDTFNVRDKHTPIPYFDITDTTVCPGTSMTVNIPVALPPGTIDYQWSTGDATDFITISVPDEYWVVLTDECGIGFSDTFQVSITDTSLPAFVFADTIICSGKPLTVTGPTGNFAYLWSNGQTTPGTTIQSAGVYSLTITHRCGNSRTASFEVMETNDPEWNTLPENVTICTGDTVALDATPGFASYQWSNGDTARTLRTSSAGIYTVTATGKCDQHTSSTTVIAQDPPQPFSLGYDTTICAGEVFMLSAPAGYTYQWNTGNTQSNQSVSDAGTYTCVVSNDCGSVPASITVSTIQPPQPPLVITGATDLCRLGTMQPVTLTTPMEGFNLRWNTSATTPQITISTPGTYILTAYNDCGSITDSVYVRGCKGIIGFPTAFSPNGDGKNDIFRPVLQDVGLIAEFHLQVFNRWGNIVFETNDPLSGWDGSIKGVPATSATYFWQCRIKNTKGDERVEKGDVSLVR